jgi:hypothetical protein
LSRPIRHLVTNDEKEVIKGPNIATFLRWASRGADLPEVLPPNLLGGDRNHVRHGCNRCIRGCHMLVRRGQAATVVWFLQSKEGDL